VIVIVGHGPSILCGLGDLIDSHTVVRLKRGLLETHDRRHWGSRTDYLCARSRRFDHGQFPFWLSDYEYGGAKPTTGLSAVAEARARCPTEEIAVIGFDRLMHPESPDSSNTWLAHDKWAEHELLKTWGIRELA